MTIPASPHADDAPAGRGVVLRDPLPWPDVRQIVRTVEETGYEAVFVPEIAAREAFTTLAGFAQCTSRLRLGTGVVTVGSRSPTTTAMAAATLHGLSGGRVVLGLGAGSASSPPAAGVRSILDVVTRYVRVLREALSGEPVGPDDLFGAEGFQLGLEMRAEPIPIWLGALGDGLIRLSGKIADGVILNWCTPDRVAEAARLIREEADASGRDPDEMTIAVYVRVCLGVDEAVALEALGPMAGQYAAIPHYHRQFQRMGLGEDALAAARALAEGRPSDVPRGFVRALCVTGGRKAALERFRAYREAGADTVLVYPVPALDPFSSVLGSVLAAAPSPSLER